MITNNTTLVPEINGSGIDLTAEVDLTVTQADTRFANSGHVARFKRQVGSNNYVVVGPEIQLSITTGVDIQNTVTWRDTNVTANTTYKYFLEMDVTVESGIILQ